MNHEVRAALARARADRPELGATIALQLDLVADPAATRIDAGFVERAAARMAAGLPAIDPVTLRLDWEAFARRLGEVAEIVASHYPSLAAAAREAAAQATTRRSVQFFLGGGPVDALAAFLLAHTLRPFLRPFVEAALATSEAARWSGGSCPACGGAPDFAVLEGDGGARRLLCGRCDAEWAHARTGCPFCGNQDRETLGYFGTGDAAHRLYVCDRCNRYLKTLDLRATWRRPSLPAERVLAVGMDLAAARAGYHV